MSVRVRRIDLVLSALARASVALIAYALLARLLTWAAFEAGWPANHERLAMFERVEMYRRAFVAHDWLPLWTPYPAAGHGSAMPLIYHRLFSGFGGLLALKIGALRATRWSLVVGLALGGYGMHRAAATLGARRGIRLAAGVLFVASPYVLTDWLIRGAVAEFSAMMVLPWFLAALVRFSRGEAVGVRLGLLGALLFHAHSMICLFALPMPVIAGLVAIARPGRPGTGMRAAALLRVASAGLQFSAIFLLLTGPFLVAITLVRSRFRFEVLDTFHAAHEYTPWSRHLLDNIEWGVNIKPFSVEVGVAIVVLCAGFGFVAFTTRTRVVNGPFVFLVLSLALYAYLLHPASTWVYYRVPGASLLQFPWRLLVFVAPIGVLLACTMAQALVRDRARAHPAVSAVLALAALYQVLFTLDGQKITYDREDEGGLGGAVTALSGLDYDEYLPRSFRTIPQRTPLVVLAGCQLAKGSAPLPPTEHFKRIDLSLDVDADCSVDISQFCSPILEVVTSRGTVSCSPTATYHVQIPKGEPVKLSVRQRSLWSLIGDELRRRRPYFAGEPRSIARQW